jgi:hypothetical protein
VTTLSPGAQFLVAPHFPPVTDWSHRLRLSAGVTVTGDCAFPREPWREPREDELPFLVRDPSLPLTQADLDASVALLTLPGHLMTSWWQLLAQATSLDAGLPGFDVFLRRVCEFLAFKKLLPPTGLGGELVACPPGRPSLRTMPDTNEPAGLGWSATPPGLWGLCNLGAETAQVTFFNRAIGDPVRAADLLASAPEAPLIGLRLEPGEGCRLPPAGLLLDASTVGKDTPDLWLLLHATAPERGGVPS